MITGLLLVSLLFCAPVLAQEAGARRAAAPTAYQQFARQMHVISSVPKTICYKTEQNAFTKILPPDAFVKGRRNPKARQAPTAQILVTYTGFTPEAQAAFQYAVDIWAQLIVSPVPIRIQANWVTQNPGVLGSAGPTTYLRSSDGTQKSDGFYAIALAEKIARRELNGSDQADINADFNRNNNWYYGLDGKTPAGQTDLVTVVLHEIGHGLGFIGFYRTTGDRASIDGASPAVYDYFIENGQGQRLVTATTAYPSNSNALYRQLTGNNLFLNGPVMRQRTGQRAKLFAPSTFDLGSSVYHLDESTYPRRDTNSLMTPQLANAEAIHSPGPLVLNFFSDMEWKTTSVLHDNNALASALGEDLKDVDFRVRIVSDTTVNTASVRLFYRKGPPTARDTTFTAVTPTRIGTTDEYSYVLPAAQAQGEVWYYFQAQDASGRTFSNPGKQATGLQTLHRLIVGPDVIPPTIQYSPAKNFIFTTAVADSLPIYVDVSDDRPAGIDTAYVEYQINGQPRPALPLRYTTSIGGVRYDSLYVNRLQFPANSLNPGDRITYRIVARDSSRARNQTVSPATGFYELAVVPLQAVQDRYVNDFNQTTTASDFVSFGFSVTQPAGFTNPAMHSEHPYRNGTSFNFESNYETVLRTPIRIMSNPDSAVIRFDEVVLVEPGEDGSTFGNANFFDYVVVEGSNNNGQTWQPITAGYDSRSNPDWLAAYNQNSANGSEGEQNSTTVGTLGLFKPRVIPILGSPFRPGEQILIRFRLFADQLSHGWGWAIDNLRIQVPPPPPVLANEPISAGRFTVYPNPISNGLTRVEAELVKPVAEAGLTIAGSTGQTLRQLTLKGSGTKLNEQIDLSQLPTGLYFLKLKAGDAVLTQKVIIAR
ncbi:T9SS type A sorting domain-containing protein [Spirosoma soli]|uniref:T9SS type A sorting domain-containing protein n=2 Tax=Spirosoma soli TaxID=1770529 RepID=A0ABW5MAD3_9BACT